MAFDLAMFSDKLRRYMEQFQTSFSELAELTGIEEKRLREFDQQQSTPSGDEILILADVFMCDYKFFISNEKLASFEQTENLFRKHGSELSKADRWAIQEFLYLCECEEFLLNELEKDRTRFVFRKQGQVFKDHGQQAAAALRKHLGYSYNEIPLNIYKVFTTIGCHVFRRKLESSSISGLCVRHPTAGPCLLINYSEDVYRQRFSAAHEAAHAILDDEKDFVVSFKWDKKDLSEIRANTFASHFLLPPDYLRNVPVSDGWTTDKIYEWGNKLKVNVDTLIFALAEKNLISEAEKQNLRNTVQRIKQEDKEDPEIPSDLPPKSKERIIVLLQRGLTTQYISLCFEAYEKEIISSGRLREVLLVKDDELVEIANLFNKRLAYVY